MVRTLRNRLIISHILPLLVITPLMWFALVYMLESQFLLPQLSDELTEDARFLAEVTRSEYILWGNPYYFEAMLSRLELNPSVFVMFMTPDGVLLFSSQSRDRPTLGQVLEIPGLAQARNGFESVIWNYSAIRPQNELIQVLTPVYGIDGSTVGIVRVTYQNTFIQGLFSQFRYLIAGVLILGLVFGGILGSLLAVNIGKPVQNVTQAIYELARGTRSESLVEEGPEEMRNLVRAVNYLVGQLHSLEQARRQLLANLVHELGRPLGALRSAIQALAKGAGQDPQLLEDLVVGMDDQTARLQHVLEDLAHLHDQVLGTLELNREPLTLQDWLPKMLRPWQEAAREKNIHWKVDIPPGIPVVQADPVRLSQVVGNLVSNAIRYTPGGRSISITAGAEPSQVWIQVSDTGPGIPADEQEKIFTPFYRGDQGRRIKQGMGLGLSIARSLTSAHGGTLKVESTPGIGSHFTVWLPLDPTP